MSWFRRTKRFGVILALIATLSSSCRKQLPPEEFQKMQPYLNRVESAIKKGEVDKEATKNLVKLIREFDKEGYRLKGVDLPENFWRGVEYLRVFYVEYDNIKSLHARFYDGNSIMDIFHLQTALGNAETVFGFTLDDEKEMLISLIREAIQTHDKEIQINKQFEESGHKNKIYMPTERLQRWNKDLNEMLKNAQKL